MSVLIMFRIEQVSAQLRFHKRGPSMTAAFRHVLMILLCTAAGADVGAEERIVYRSEMPDGRVLYGDAPVSGARQSTRLQIERHAANPQQEEAAQRALALTRAQILRDADARAARLRQLDNLASDAYENVRRAQEQREAGRSVVEGDKQGRRLTPSYWERQRQLENRFRVAQQRLESLLSERTALQN